MSIPLRLLLVEDNVADAELMLRELRRAGFEPSWQRVETEPEFLASLQSPLDLILADFHLPQFDGARALQRLRESGLDIPFILVSGTIGEDVAVMAMREGATDYLLKDRLARLGPSVSQALEQKRLRDDKRRIEQAMRDSERRFRALIENSGDAVALISPRGTILYESPAVTRILGYVIEERIGWNVFARMHPDDVEGARVIFNQLLQERGGRATLEAREKHKDGSWRCMEVSASNLLGEPSVQAVVWNYRDITARRRAEARVRDSEATLSAAQQIAHLGSWELNLENLDDINQNPLHWSDEVFRIFGYKPGGIAVSNENFFAAVHPDDRAAISQAVQRAIHEHVPYSLEHRIILPDGSQRIVHERSHILHDAQTGRSVKMLGTILDITERKHAERALRESEERYRELFENANDILYTHDLTGKFTSVNRAGELLTGYTRDEVLQMNIAQLVAPPYVEQARQLIREKLQGRDATIYELEILDKQGRPLLLEVSTRLIYQEGKPVGVQGIARDIGERKRAEDALRQSEQQYRSLFAAAQRQARELTLLDTVRSALFRELDLSSAIHTVVEAIAEMFGYKYVSLYLLQAETLMLQHQVGYEQVISTMPITRGVMGRVVRTGQPVLLEDVSSDPEFLAAMEGIVSEVSVPLFDQGQVAGVLNVETTDGVCLSESDLRLITTLSEYISLGIGRARLFAETKRRAEQLAAINTLGRKLTETLDVNEVYERLYETTHQLMPDIPSMLISRYDAQRQLIHWAYVVNDEQQLPVAELPSVPLVPPGQGPQSDAIHTHQPQIVNDLQARIAHTKTKYHYGDERQPQSALYLPMLAQGEVIGVLQLQSYERNRFSPADAELLTFVANTAAIAVVNARLFAETARRADEFAELYNMTRDLAAQNDLNALLHMVAERAGKLLAAPNVGVMLYDPARDDLELVVSTAYPNATGYRQSLDEGITGRVARTREPLFINQYQDSEWRAGDAHSDIRSALAVPMLNRGELIGVLGISEQGDSQRVFSEGDVRLLSLFAAHAASAVNNAQLLGATLHYGERQAALYRISTALAGTRGVDAACDAVVAATREFLGYGSVAVFLRDPETGDRVLHAASAETHGAKGFRLRAGEGVSEQTLLSGQLHYWSDTSATPSYVAGMANGRCEVDVPINLGGETLGVLVVEETRVEGFTSEDFDLLHAVANQLAIAIEGARLFEETQRRLAELEAVNKISSALRTAQTLGEMLPIIMDETLAALGTDTGTVRLYNAEQDGLQSVVARGWFTSLTHTSSLTQSPAGRVFLTGQPYIHREFRYDEQLRAEVRAQIPAGWGGAIVPLRAGAATIGVMIVALRLPREAQASDMRLLSTLAEIAGNAIHRARLFEETERRVQYLAALHKVDMAITASVDLRVTLNVLLDQVTSQLGIDAAAVMLLDPHSQTLEFGAARGFRSSSVTRVRLRLGESFAGRIALERRLLSVPKLASAPESLPRVPLFISEKFNAYFGFPLIAKGEVKGVLELFHRTTLNPDPEWLEFLETMAGQAAIALDNTALFDKLQRSNLELVLAYDTTLEGWSRALDLRDKETEGHTLRVTETTMGLARAMGLSEAELVHVRRGALLHDIGKMGIPDSILLKPDKLTEDEWAVMRMHPVYAYELLSPISYLRRALDIPYAHHEKWDGTGYPRGLKGEAIPIAARIFAVVDVYDALRSDRPYRKGWSDEQVRAHIRALRGTHFDAQVVDRFLSMDLENLD